MLARWGGLGTHRYNVGFTGSGANVLVTVLTLPKGDVAGLSWANLAYQPYFSLTAVSHIILAVLYSLVIFSRLGQCCIWLD